MRHISIYTIEAVLAILNVPYHPNSELRMMLAAILHADGWFASRPCRRFGCTRIVSRSFTADETPACTSTWLMRTSMHASTVTVCASCSRRCTFRPTTCSCGTTWPSLEKRLLSRCCRRSRREKRAPWLRWRTPSKTSRYYKPRFIYI